MFCSRSSNKEILDRFKESEENKQSSNLSIPIILDILNNNCGDFEVSIIDPKIWITINPKTITEVVNCFYLSNKGKYKNALTDEFDENENLYFSIGIDLKDLGKFIDGDK